MKASRHHSSRIPTATNIAFTETVDGATVLSVSHSAVTNTATYDAYRREVVRTDGRGNATTNAYDTLGRLVSVTDPLGATTHYAYDAVGNLVAVTNALGNATIYEYDLRGNKTYEGGATYPVRYTYDDFDNKTTMTTFRDESLQSGDTTTWLYDEPTGLLTNKVYADGKGYSCTYTVDGRLQFKTETSGRWKEFLYNAWGELANTIYSDGAIISTLRDAYGREVLETNNVASILKWRDEFGNVTNETISVGAESLVIERLYDDEGRAACLASGLSISYDASGKFSAISNNEAIVQYAYNSDGSEAGYTISLSNGIVFARNVYRDNEHLARITAISNCINGVLVENFDYDYDLLGRPVVRNSDTFGYNGRSEVVFSHRGAENAEDGYAYDDIGNLLVSYANVNTNSYVANSLNQYTAIHEISAFFAPLREINYDLDGNLTNDSVFAYSYDAQNRLVSVSSNDVALLVNEYDSKSRRVRKITQEATTTFFYDDWNLIEERIARTNGTTSTIKYYWGKDLSGALQGSGGVGGLLYQTVDDVIYIPCYDNNGNITKYIDSTGNIVASYTYNAFGHLISKSGALADFFRHRFSTKFFDAETGLYYYGYRFYHPRFMRWLNRDPIEEEGGLNLYATCANALIISFDILGKDDGTVIVEGLGAGWAGAKITLKGRTAIQLNGERYYLTMKHQQGMYIPKGGPTSTLYLFKAGNVKKGLRLDYHELPVHSNNPPEWHINIDGHSGIAKVANSRSLDHTTSPKIKALGKTVTVFKYGGRICFVVGAGMSAVDIYRADNRVREAVRQIGGWSGAVVGSKLGASLGSSGGMTTAVALGQMGPQIATPEEVVTVPIFGFIGAAGGGIVGGISGFFFGVTVAEKVYDWRFAPLEKEEWEVGCEQK